MVSAAPLALQLEASSSSTATVVTPPDGEIARRVRRGPAVGDSWSRSGPGSPQPDATRFIFAVTSIGAVQIFFLVMIVTTVLYTAVGHSLGGTIDRHLIGPHVFMVTSSQPHVPTDHGSAPLQQSQKKTKKTRFHV